MNLLRVPTRPGKPGKQNQFSSHGKHMENERKGKMSWEILNCPRKLFQYFPLAENELLSVCQSSPSIPNSDVQDHIHV